MQWQDSQDQDYVGNWLQVSSVGSFSVMQKFIDSGNYVQSKYRGVDTPTMAQKNATLEMMEREMVTKVIMGASLDEFDKFCGELEDAGGGDAMTQEMNDTLDTSNRITPGWSPRFRTRQRGRAPRLPEVCLFDRSLPCAEQSAGVSCLCT